MHIGLVWNADAKLAAISIRYDLFSRGFAAAGHRCTLICREGTSVGYPIPAVEFAPGREDDPRLWRDLGLDVALVITWHQMAGLLGAVRAAGAVPIAIPDSDGQVGTRAHFWPCFTRLAAHQPTVRLKIGCLKASVVRYLVGAQAEAKQIVASTRESRAVLFGGPSSAEAFRLFLKRHHAGHLRKRVRVCPLYSVADHFLHLPLGPKANRVAAVGRWEDPQKNAHLLARAIRRYRAAGGSAEFILVGSGGADVFGSLTQEIPGVTYCGRMPPGEVARLLGACRVVVFSSRWEGYPHTANEALAVGATVVGPPIPCLRDIAWDGRFGRVAAAGTGRALADSIAAELAAWERGDRDPTVIAAHWRKVLDPRTVCEGILAAANIGPGCLGR